LWQLRDAPRGRGGWLSASAWFGAVRGQRDADGLCPLCCLPCSASEREL
jgi:hypothetical protein